MTTFAQRSTASTGDGLGYRVIGVRLADVLSVAESFNIRVDIGAALGLLRQVAAALGRLHAAADNISHGCIGPERLLLTSDGSVIETEYVLGCRQGSRAAAANADVPDPRADRAPPRLPRFRRCTDGQFVDLRMSSGGGPR